MDLRFLQAEHSHVDKILSLMSEFCAYDHYPFEQELRQVNLQKFISDPNLGRLWIMEHDHQVAGYVVLAFSFSFEFKGRDAFIDELFIREPFRGKGIGGKTIDFVVDRARNLGVKAIHLEVEKHNERGNHFTGKRDSKTTTGFS